MAREAAQTLGITHSALKCRVSRARAQLASNLVKAGPLSMQAQP